MGKIIAIAGCRAVGKTTLQRSLKAKYPEIIAYEKRRNESLHYNLDIESEYYLNEKYYINREVADFHRIKASGKDAILIRGPEHLEFSVFHYPKCHGKDWDIERGLSEELKALRACRSDYILYLTASTDVVLDRCKNDRVKQRDPLHYWLTNWQPYIDNFIRSLNNVTFLNTDHMSQAEVLEWASKWIESLPPSKTICSVL